MLEPLRKDAEGQGLHLGDGLVAVLAVAQDPRQGRHLSQPTAISFAFEFDRERHPGTVYPRSTAQQGREADAGQHLWQNPRIRPPRLARRSLGERMATNDYAFAAEVLRSGERAKLEALAESLVGFPEGVDSWLGRRWILNAIDVGARSTIEWMLEKRVNLAFRDEEGYTPLFAVIDSQRTDRYDILELLLRAGAPANLKGRNEWTAAHLAAARDDVEALRILVAHGADLSIRTDIDDFATPLEEARILGSRHAVAFLESVA